MSVTDLARRVVEAKAKGDENPTIHFFIARLDQAAMGTARQAEARQGS